jgi:hypothetical protein
VCGLLCDMYALCAFVRALSVCGVEKKITRQ